MAELCRIYEISRESGYKWLRRSQVEGKRDLQIAAVPRLDIPIRPSHRLSSSCWHCASDMRRGERASYGLTYNRSSRRLVLPAASTIGALLKREGLTVPRRQLRKTPPYTQPFQQAIEPNQLWCADFKGWFRTLDRQRIDPLTISDTASRYLLRCQAVEKTNTEHVRAIFEAAFRRVWSAGSHSHRQRATLCLQSHCRTFAAGALLDEAGHRAGADRARSSRTERPPRTHASHAEGGDDPPPGSSSARTTRGL